MIKYYKLIQAMNNQNSQTGQINEISNLKPNSKFSLNVFQCESFEISQKNEAIEILSYPRVENTHHSRRNSSSNSSNNRVKDIFIIKNYFSYLDLALSKQSQNNTRDQRTNNDTKATTQHASEDSRQNFKESSNIFDFNKTTQINKDKSRQSNIQNKNITNGKNISNIFTNILNYSKNQNNLNQNNLNQNNLNQNNRSNSNDSSNNSKEQVSDPEDADYMFHMMNQSNENNKIQEFFEQFNDNKNEIGKLNENGKENNPFKLIKLYDDEIKELKYKITFF